LEEWQKKPKLEPQIEKNSRVKKLKTLQRHLKSKQKRVTTSETDSLLDSKRKRRLY
jgi:hypothetical protein